MGYEFFDFLSAIDWLPSPFGRDMDAQEDLVGAEADPAEPAPLEQGYAGGDTRFQVIAHVWSVRTAPRHPPQGRPPRRRPHDRLVGPGLPRRQLARA